MRSIKDILNFRGDLTPFLTHLTRAKGEQTSRQVLLRILREGQLKPGPDPVSDARFGINTLGLTGRQISDYFGAICFTETPLNEIHCLLEINYRQVNLSPYGLVFLQAPLLAKGVSPVHYINNSNNGQNATVRAMVRALIQKEPEAAKNILPLMAVFGRKLTPPGARQQTGKVDFTWEREWRYPAHRGPLDFTRDDIFIGLCPDSDIADFETRFPPLNFVDPQRNLKWYAKSLIDARQRHDIKVSVV